MNTQDRQYLDERFCRIEAKLEKQDIVLAVLETKWSMIWKIAGLVSGCIALGITLGSKLFGR